MNIGLPHFLTISAALFSLGLFAVMARRDGAGPLEARPVPLVHDSGPADPPDGWKYVIERIRLMEVGP